MSKSPAFQLYVQDFLSGVKHFSASETGAYILLLCEQWDSGFIEISDKFCKKITGISLKKLEKVIKKFQLCEDGKYRNFKLETIRLEQEKFRERQRNNGSKGGRPKIKSNTQPKPIENPRVIFGETQSKPLQSSSSYFNNDYVNKKLRVGASFFNTDPVGYLMAYIPIQFEDITIQYSGELKNDLTGVKNDFNTKYMALGFTDERHILSAYRKMLADKIIKPRIFNDSQQKTGSKFDKMKSEHQIALDTLESFKK